MVEEEKENAENIRKPEERPNRKGLKLFAYFSTVIIATYSIGNERTKSLVGTYVPIMVTHNCIAEWRGGERSRCALLISPGNAPFGQSIVLLLEMSLTQTFPILGGLTKAHCRKVVCIGRNYAFGSKPSHQQGTLTPSLQ